MIILRNFTFIPVVMLFFRKRGGRENRRYYFSNRDRGKGEGKKEKERHFENQWTLSNIPQNSCGGKGWSGDPPPNYISNEI